MKQRRIMVLSLAVVCVCVVLIVMVKKKEKSPVEQFVGTWTASEYALESDIYTGYLRMEVKKDGSFSIYDAEAGNPGISGTMSVAEDDKIKVECSGDDFDSPWEGLKETDYLSYHFDGENKVSLTYGEKTIEFSK